MQKIDARIQQLIEIKSRTKISQEKLAHSLGVSTQTIHRWLTGKHRPLVYLEPVLDKFIQKNG